MMVDGITIKILICGWLKHWTERWLAGSVLQGLHFFFSGKIWSSEKTTRNKFTLTWLRKMETGMIVYGLAQCLKDDLECQTKVCFWLHVRELTGRNGWMWGLEGSGSNTGSPDNCCWTLKFLRVWFVTILPLLLFKKGKFKLRIWSACWWQLRFSHYVSLQYDSFVTGCLCSFLAPTFTYGLNHFSHPQVSHPILAPAATGICACLPA